MKYPLHLLSLFLFTRTVVQGFLKIASNRAALYPSAVPAFGLPAAPDSIQITTTSTWIPADTKVEPLSRQAGLLVLSPTLKDIHPGGWMPPLEGSIALSGKTVDPVSAALPLIAMCRYFLQDFIDFRIPFAAADASHRNASRFYFRHQPRD